MMAAVQSTKSTSLHSFLAHLKDDIDTHDAVERLIRTHPPAATAIEKIIHYFVSRRSTEKPSSKKRKLSDSYDPNDATRCKGTGEVKSKEPARYIMKEQSFLNPRKKMDLHLGTSVLSLLASKGGIRSVEQSLSFSDIERVVCVELPDKAKKHWAVSIFLQSETDPIVFSFPDTGEGSTVWRTEGEGESKLAVAGQGAEAVKKMITEHMFASSGRGPAGRSLPFWEEDSIDGFRASGGAFRKTSSSSSSATGTNSQPSTPYVTAFLGARDGRLFFLPRGIFYGFRKPVLFLPHRDIRGVSVAGVTSRTFNLSVKVATSGAGDEQKNSTEEIIFDMIDSSEFEPINTYILNHRLESGSPRSGDVNNDDEIIIDSSKSNSAVSGDGAHDMDEDYDEELDEDFVPQVHIVDVAEEYESDYESEEGEGGSEDEREGEEDDEEESTRGKQLKKNKEQCEGL